MRQTAGILDNSGRPLVHAEWYWIRLGWDPVQGWTAGYWCDPLGDGGEFATVVYRDPIRPATEGEALEIGQRIPRPVET